MASPEQRLFAEILLQALDDLAIGQGQEALSAWRWISQCYPTFILCCTVLELDHDAVRRAIMHRFAERIEQVRRGPQPRYTGHRPLKAPIDLRRVGRRSYVLHTVALSAK